MDMVSVQDLDPTAMDTTAMVSINNVFQVFGCIYVGAVCTKSKGTLKAHLSNWHSQTAQHSNF